MVGWLLAVPAMLALGLGPAPAPTIAPDGLVVRLGALERLPAADGAACDRTGACRPGAAPGRVLVRVDVVLGLPPSAPAPIGLDIVAGTAGGIALLVGVDHRRAEVDCGFVGEKTALCTDSGSVVPTRVDPGAEVTVSETFDVPAGDLATLVVTAQPPVTDGTGANPVATITFTGAEALLTG